MATRIAQQVNPGLTPGYVLWRYENVGAGDTCLPITVGGYRELTVQSVSGSWGTKVVTWEATLNPDGSDTLPITDAQSGSGLTHSANGLDEILQIPTCIQPIISGSGGTAITIWVLGKLN